MSAQLEDKATAIGVRRVAGNIGALITGVDIAQPLDPQAVAEIRQALLTHKVIFFRGQDLDHTTQIAFARQFGDLTHAHPHEDAPPQDARRSSPSTRGATRSGTAPATRSGSPAGSTATSLAGTPTSRRPSTRPRVDPARADRAGVRRGHHLDQPGGRVRGTVL